MKTVKRDKKYIEFIKDQPCLVCCSPGPSDPHRVRMGTDGGMGLKPSDKYAVPLCHTHHQVLHHYGERVFWENTKEFSIIDVFEEIRRLNRIYKGA